MKRTTLPLLGGLLLLAGCQDRELPTALAPERASFAQVAGSPVVNSLADNGDGTCDDAGTGDGCTLREAIAFASSGATITFALGLTGTITLNGTALLIAKNLTITGPGAASLTVSGNNASRVFQISSPATVQISGLTITAGNAGPFDFGGGGIYNFRGTLTLSHSIVSGNTGSEGGGIHNFQGTLTLSHSTVSGNTASDGGGIINLGTLTLSHSTVSGNTTTGPGGGIYSATSSDLVTSSTTLINSTVSGNTAIFGGGGIHNQNGLTRIVHSTVTNNRAGTTADAGGGVWSWNDGATQTDVRNSLIWGNSLSDGTTANDVAAFETVNRYNSLGHNLIGVAGENVDFVQEFNQTGDQTGVGAGSWLGPLALNAPGTTKTHALGAGSPALVAGTCTDHEGNPVATDQRGVSRPQGAGCDIGAFELEQTPPPAGYSFVGFTAPVSNPDTLNVAKAGQTIALKWRLLQGGQPVTTLSSVAVKVESLICSAGTTTDNLEEYAAGKSGLQNLGDGYYQYNWATPKSYANSCKTLTLTLGDGIGLAPQALFKFTK